MNESSYNFMHNLFEVCWLCLTSHRQRGHLETVPPFTVPCEGRESRYLHRFHRELNPGPSRGSPLHYRCATPLKLKYMNLIFIEARIYIQL